MLDSECSGSTGRREDLHGQHLLGAGQPHASHLAPLQVKDGRVSASVNEEFLDTLEAYFGQAETDKTADVRAHLSYQVR